MVEITRFVLIELLQGGERVGRRSVLDNVAKRLKARRIRLEECHLGITESVR